VSALRPREYSASFPPAPSVAIVAAICGAEILSLAGFSIVPALLPQFIETWSLTNTQAGRLAGITSAGYMLAGIPLVSLTDRRPARQLYLASSVLSALSCFAMALCDSLLPALGFRAVAGIAMAGMYMPGLRALTHGAEGAARARIAAWYTSSFTIGASLSFLFGRVGTLLGWRSAFVIAGILGAAGVLIAWAALLRGDSADEEEPQPLLDFRPVFANRDVLALTVGYAAASTAEARARMKIPCATPSRTSVSNGSAFCTANSRPRTFVLSVLSTGFGAKPLVALVSAAPLAICSLIRCGSLSRPHFPAGKDAARSLADSFRGSRFAR
jgi:MFS family permease